MAHQSSPQDFPLEDRTVRAEAALLKLVKAVGATICDAHDVGVVTGALSVLSSLLFSHDVTIREGDFSQLNQLVLDCKNEAIVLTSNENSMEVFRQLFYGGSSFSILSKILFSEVASNWLACFTSYEQTNLFDSFFVLAPPSDSLLALVPALLPACSAVDDGFPLDTTSVCAVAERLLVNCLFENEGLKKIALYFASITNDDAVVMNGRTQKNFTISSLVQLIASIPDKARPEAPSSLLSLNFHFSVTSQLLGAAEEIWRPECSHTDKSKASFLVIGEILGKFCRRGHADVVASQMFLTLNQYIEWKFGVSQDSFGAGSQMPEHMLDEIVNEAKSNFWTGILDSMKDIHATERFAKAFLLEMASKQVTDCMAYCMLSVLFLELVAKQSTVRLLFTERFLFCCVFPIRCLRWILQFAVLCCPPGHSADKNGFRKDITWQLINIWGGEHFLQTTEMQQQVYITVAIGLLLRSMTREDLEGSGDILQRLLQGISRRLESPLDMVRTMAKKVAFSFSLVIDKKNPLLLDDKDTVENLTNWEQLDSYDFGLITVSSEHEPVINQKDAEATTEGVMKCDAAEKEKLAKRKKDKSKSEAYDPDEIIDLRTYTPDSFSDEDTGCSDLESESSLQPYDLSDDESDLQRGQLPTQLHDCAANLRKGDQPDVVRGALEVLEGLIWALPDELDNTAPDLAHALIHVRCSAVAIEGEEQSIEDQRYNALVALLVRAPQTIAVFNQELYSPHVDIGQRLLVLEVMSDAARELASASVAEVSREKPLMISEVDAKWYGPGNALAPAAAGPWREVNDSNAMVSFVHKYEREIPRRSDSKSLGKSRRWGKRSLEIQAQQRNQGRGTKRKNMFVPLAASFMLPAMRDYDKKQHCIDLLGSDFIVLGRLICMLGVCIECASLHPEAVILGAHLLNMLRTREVSNHPEAFVRRACLYTASRVIISLHPAHVASAVSAGDYEIADGLDWIHTWALKIADDDTDTECSSMALVCLRLHSELMLQASHCMEMSNAKTTGGSIQYKLANSNILSL